MSESLSKASTSTSSRLILGFGFFTAFFTGTSTEVSASSEALSAIKLSGSSMSMSEVSFFAFYSIGAADGASDLL